MKLSRQIQLQETVKSLIDELVPYRIQRIYNSSSPREKVYLKKILEEIAETGDSQTYRDIWLEDYIEIPVDIDTFICDDYYLGKTNRNGAAVYPYWRDFLRKLFHAGNKYEEVMLTGATRIGKSSTAITGTSYMLYKLMCLRDPQAYFGKKDISVFSILFFNLTKELAAGVAYREFQDTILSSPWFLNHGKRMGSDKNPYYVPDGGKVTIDYGSDAAHSLGKQVFCSVMDEINFSRAGVKDVNKAKAHMMDLYNTVAARVKGTFRMEGEVYGKIFAVSSKRGDSDFMEAYMKQQIDSGAGDHMLIADAPQWEVLPPSMFSEGKFYVAVGDRHKKGFVVPDNQTDAAALADLKAQGYRLLTPPIDMRPEFVADFDIALRDLAGIAVVGSLSFITQEALTACINLNRRNPVFTDLLQIGTKDKLTIEEFFHLEVIPEEYKRMPLFLHLDLSLTTDNSGIGGVCINGRKDMDIDGRKLSVPTFGHVFSFGLSAPRGDKIPYSKILNFICWLRRKGFNIAGVSRDQYQSEYLGELLEEQGFTVTKISVDRTPDPYISLRSVLLEQRIDLLDVQLLQDELVHLQRDASSGVPDHPIGGCFTGDTKVRLVDGRSLTILDLMQEQSYKTNWVYTINESTLKIEPKRIKSVHQTKITRSLIRVTLDNGEVITCTPDHRFMLRDGSYEQAQNLFEGCSLMPLYTKLSEKGIFGYRLYYEPTEDSWHFEHRQFCCPYEGYGRYVVHHCNFNKLDNCPTNLEPMSSSEHSILHNNRTKDYRKVSEGLKDWYSSIEGTSIQAERNTKCREGTIAALKRLGKYRVDAQQERIKAIEETFNVKWENLSKVDRNRYGLKYSRLIDPSIGERIVAAVVENHKLGKYKNAEEAISGRVWYTDGVDSIYIKSDEVPPEGYYPGRTLSEASKLHMREAAKNMSEETSIAANKKRSIASSNHIWITNGVDNLVINKDTDIPEGFYRGRVTPWQSKKNHKVVSVEFISYPCRVYDLTIEDNPNFALDAGVFVHNSKDLADGLAGAVWNAIKTNPPIPVPTKSIAKAMQGINQRRSYNNPLPSMFGNQYRKF